MKKYSRLTWDRTAAEPLLGWEVANLEVLLGAEEAREPEDFGVAAERCCEACLTMFALSMTGLSAIKDPKNTLGVTKG